MEKKSPKGRKRSAKTAAGGTASSSSAGQTGSEENCWDCSVCTFRNNAEAFKCSVCGVRKGTSTRKPRLNPDLVAAQQQAQALTPPPAAGSGTAAPIPSSSGVSIKSPVSPSTSIDNSGVGGSTGGGSVAGEDEEETDLAALASLKANKRVSKDKLEKKEPRKTSVNRARLKNVDRSSATYHSVTVNDFTVVITEFKPKVKKEKKEKPAATATSTSATSSSGVKDVSPSLHSNAATSNGNSSSSVSSSSFGGSKSTLASLLSNPSLDMKHDAKSNSSVTANNSTPTKPEVHIPRILSPNNSSSASSLSSKAMNFANNASTSSSSSTNTGNQKQKGSPVTNSHTSSSTHNTSGSHVHNSSAKSPVGARGDSSTFNGSRSTSQDSSKDNSKSGTA